MQDKIIFTLIILFMLSIIIEIIAGIAIMTKAIKKAYIVVRCKMSSSYQKRYTDEQIHKTIKQNLELYYPNKKKSRYKKLQDNSKIYMQDIYNQYEDWRNPKP